MAITTGGGIGYDRAAFRAQRAQQLNQNLMQAAAFREQQLLNKAARFKDTWDWITSLDQYKEDSDRFIAENPALMQSMAEMASEITGRKLGSQQALEFATWLQKQGATNPTIGNAYNRSVRGDANQVGPEAPRPAGGRDPEGTSKAVPPPAVTPPPAASPAPVAPAPQAAAPVAPPSPTPQRAWAGGVSGVPWASPRQPLAATSYLDSLGVAVTPPQGTFTPEARAAQAAATSHRALYQQALDKYVSDATSPEELEDLTKKYFTDSMDRGLIRYPLTDYVIGLAAKEAAKLKRAKASGADEALQLHATGKPSGGTMDPADLARHEAATGDVHYPALVGVKEGIVNARAMENGGDAVVRALNERYPVYAGGKASEDASALAEASAGGAYRYTDAELARKFRDLQQDAMSSMAGTPVPPGTGPAPVQGYQDITELATEAGPGLRVGSRMVRPIERALGKAAVETTKIAAAANQIVATSKGIGSKTPAAKVPPDFGKALEGLVAGADDLRMRLGGAPSKRVKDLALAQREAVRIGQITESAYRALPAEQREAMLRKMDDLVQARSPEFWATMGRQDVADARSASEIRKVQMTQAMASMMASSSKQMSDMLGPINQAFAQYGNLMQISESNAKVAGKPLQDFWATEGKGMLDQLNTYGYLISQFAKSFGMNIDMQLFIKQVASGPFGLFKKNAIASGDGTEAPATLDGMVSFTPQEQDFYKRYLSGTAAGAGIP